MEVKRPSPRRHGYRPLFGLIIVLWILIYPIKVHAQVVINEVFPNPPGSNSYEPDEWIELYNLSDTLIDLSGWQIRDLKGSTTAYALIDLSIGPKGYLVLEKAVTKISLSNSDADGVELLNPQAGVADSTAYPANIPENQSWGRETDGGTAWMVIDQPSKGSGNHIVITINTTITETPSLSNPSGSVKLSEIFACPETGGKEWVELYNEGETAAALTGWMIRDEVGNQSPVEMVIPAKGWFIHEWPNSFLNNDGDTVNLLDNQENIKDSTAYEKCLPNASWSRLGNDWQITTTITKNLANIYTAPASPSPTGYKNPTATGRAASIQNSATNKDQEPSEIYESNKNNPARNSIAGLATQSSLFTATAGGIIDVSTLSGYIVSQATPPNDPLSSRGSVFFFAGGALCCLAGSWSYIRRYLDQNWAG
jgi:hypothetical protein